MHSWKLTKNLTDPLDPEWEDLAQTALGTNVHSERKKSFILSRQALKMALKEQGYGASIKDLILINYKDLAAFPEITISITHTKDWGAALVADRKEFLSLGIDVEKAGRVVKDSVGDRIRHPEDLATLRNIELWCLKEAAFKTLMNSGKFPFPLAFSSIQLEAGRWLHPPSGLQGEWRLEHSQDLVVAMAFLRN